MIEPPDDVEPSQFYDARRASWEASEIAGVYRLMFALLIDALNCYAPLASGVMLTRSVERAAREAEKWIFGDNKSAPFSFIKVCDALSLDPDAVRNALLERPRRVIL